MIHETTQSIERAFKQAGIKCGVREVSNLSLVEAAFTKTNCTVLIRLISEDDNAVKVMTAEIAKYPESKRQEGYKMMNELSETYKFFKFTMNDKGDVCAQTDIPTTLAPEVIGKVAIEYILTCASIVDDAYPKIMRSIWQ